MNPPWRVLALVGAGVAIVWLAAPRTASGRQAVQPAPPESLTLPTFGTVSIYAPESTPSEVVLFLSGDGGWNRGVMPMADLLRRQGALVIGLDIRALFKSLDATVPCAYPAGSLEELSRAVQVRRGLPQYLRPILVGYSSGATMVYAVLASAPPESFAGGISLGFCPDLDVHWAPCQLRGLRATKRLRGVGFDLAPDRTLSVPWIVLQGEQDVVCPPAVTREFVGRTAGAVLLSLPKAGHGFGVASQWRPPLLEAYRRIAAAQPVLPPSSSIPEVADLRLVEVPAAPGTSGDTMAVLLTGDGGWADLDKSIARGLASAGIPVVGWSSLTYYWTPRTPEQASHDLARIVERYSALWRRPRVLVIGYSFGADVAAFLVNRLPASTTVHTRIRRVVLLSPSAQASFEFHVAEWFGGERGAQYPTLPELRHLEVPALCVSARDEPGSVCHRAAGRRFLARVVGAGHHFSGDYDRIVDLILH